MTKQKALKLNKLIANTFMILAGLDIIIDQIACLFDWGTWWDYYEAFFDYLTEPMFIPLTYIAYIMLAVGIFMRIFTPLLLNVLYDDSANQVK